MLTIMRIMVEVFISLETPKKRRPKKTRVKRIELITITALRESQQPRTRCPCLSSLLLLPGMRGVESTIVACWTCYEFVSVLCGCVAYYDADSC